MDAGLGKQTGDIVSSKKASAQEEYYRYKLLEAKLRNTADAQADPLLKVQSEREAIEMSILRNLIDITESSPEFSQVADITGSRDRYEQARVLSEVVYDKVRAESILNFYTPSRETLAAHFNSRTSKSLASRSGSGRTAMNASLRASSGGASATGNLGAAAAAALTGGGGQSGSSSQ
jgi:hypothetical protein